MWTLAKALSPHCVELKIGIVLKPTDKDEELIVRLRVPAKSTQPFTEMGL